MAAEGEAKDVVAEEGEGFEAGVADTSGASAEAEEEAPPRSLDFILDIPLEVTVELGRTKMLINDLLQLGQGSVIELSKLVGEPLEILVNQKLVARGEVVVVNEKFGIRLTDIISPMERIEQLR
ncbi:MAG: flagellar motor switch protein FliN [Nitrospinota bacterium]